MNMDNEQHEKSEVGGFGGFLERFSSRALVTIMALLFLLDLFIPDPLPWIDEILLGVGTLLVARFRGRRSRPKPPPKNVTPKD